MGCGTSKGGPVLEEDAKDAPTTPPPEEATEDGSSVRSTTPDPDSVPVDPPVPAALPVLNGDDLSPAPSVNHNLSDASLTDALPEPSDESTPTSAGTHGVAFEVGDDEGGDSLIKRHPPKKFQRLEDQPQGPALTQEQLQEKQDEAERRRQEILSQRVQSAKQRTARSAGRMRSRSDVDEVETLDDATIEGAETVAAGDNEL